MRLQTALLRTVSALTLAAGCETQPEEFLLWPAGAPGAEARQHEPEESKDWWVANIHRPSLRAFLPRAGRRTNAAVVILPGGGHRQLVFGPEGVDPARFLARRGLTAFVLKYRLARAPDSPYTLDDARADAARAVRWVRSNAARFQLDARRVGVMGWSAGGELAAMLSYGESAGNAEAVDPVERESARPDFQILIYPFIAGAPDTAHGPAHDSPEAVPDDVPDTFLLAASDDLGPAATVTRLFNLHRTAHRPVELHLLARGGHGFNMGQRSPFNAVRRWPERMVEWLEAQGWLAH
jgi:dienelactone hydrolase